MWNFVRNVMDSTWVQLIILDRLMPLKMDLGFIKNNFFFTQ